MNAIWKYLIRKFQNKKFFNQINSFCPLLVYFKHNPKIKNSTIKTKIATAISATPPKLPSKLPYWNKSGGIFNFSPKDFLSNEDRLIIPSTLVSKTPTLAGRNIWPFRLTNKII